MRVPGALRRVFYHGPNIDKQGYGSYNSERRICDEAVANLVSSELDDSNLHAVAIDLDVPAYLVPSSTPGHSHLYIDVPMTWSRYAALLLALEAAGILESGYVNASLDRKATYLRVPGVLKGASA